MKTKAQLMAALERLCKSIGKKWFERYVDLINQNLSDKLPH
jgi:hypothetical protein